MVIGVKQKKAENNFNEVVSSAFILKEKRNNHRRQ